MRVIFCFLLLKTFCDAYDCGYIGDFCTITGTSTVGQCRLLGICVSARRELANNIRPQICGFEGIEPIVCCRDYMDDSLVRPTSPSTGKPLLIANTPSTASTTSGIGERTGSDVGKISAEKCKEYSRFRENIDGGTQICARISQTDPNGFRNATPVEFPHTVLIGYEPSEGRLWACQGVLLSETYVLTEESCLYLQYYGYATHVRLGGNFDRDVRDPNQVQVIKIVEYIKYPEYLLRHSVHYGKLGLLRLAERANFNQYIAPACLQKEKTINTNTFASNWGQYYSEQKSINDGLEKVDLQLVSQEDCRDVYKKDADYKAYIVPDEKQICAKSASPSKAQCTPRGPMLISNQENACMHTVIGLPTIEAACENEIENKPAVYIKVSDFLDWIENNVWLYKIN